MATTVKKTKYFYPPRPASGTDTFSDNIVGFQVVDGGGLTQANFEFTTSVVEKVNRTFNTGSFSSPMSLEDLNLDLLQSKTIQNNNFKVYPNFDISEILNFCMYGSLSKRFSVSVTNIINQFPASLDVRFMMVDLSTGNTAVNIQYDIVNDETYFEVNLDRIHNPFVIDYTVNSDLNVKESGDTAVSRYRNLKKTYIDYSISIDEVEYKVQSFLPSQSFDTGYIAFYVSGSPFGTTATTSNINYQIRPNDLIVEKIFSEKFDEIEKFLLNRLVEPIYTALFQVPLQNDFGEFYIGYEQITWQKDGDWNLDIRSFFFDDYLAKLQSLSENLDSFKTNLISRFLTAGSLKEFDTLDRKVEKVFQIYGRSFDELKKYIDGLSYMNSVNYNPSNDIPNQLLVTLSQTLGWSSEFSPTMNMDFVPYVFGEQKKPTYPGYAIGQTPLELTYSFYRSLILNSAYLFKSKGTRRSIEFLLGLIGAPESLIEFNEHIEIADRKIDSDEFNKKFARISGGTYVDEKPVLNSNDVFSLKGRSFTGFTTESTYTNISIEKSDYPFDNFGFPKSPPEIDSYFFQKGAGWYEQTPEHRSPEEIVVVGNVFKGQNTQIQNQLKPFSYGQEYLDRYLKFPYMNEGFKLTRTIDNNKSWVSTDNKLRISSQGNYNAYYYIDDERLSLNIKNIDLFLNAAQGLDYEIWQQSRLWNYPIPDSGLTVNYPVPGGVDSTFIDPKPKRKTFFEFFHTYWNNMINTRNRQFITDGKTGGYPTLQSLWWNYIQQEENIGIQNYQYSYRKLIDYINGIGDSWMKLIEQMIPATTIWQGGVRYENSVLHKQKFIYRRQRGCLITFVNIKQYIYDIQTAIKQGDLPPDTLTLLLKYAEAVGLTQSAASAKIYNPGDIIPDALLQLPPDEVLAGNIISSNLATYDANDEYVELFILPWLNENTSVNNFYGILSEKLETLLEQNGLTIDECAGINSLNSEWYLDIRIGEQLIVHEKFYNGLGPNDAPTDNIWREAVNNNLPKLENFNLGFYLDGLLLKVVNLTNQKLYLDENFSINVGININLTC